MFEKMKKLLEEIRACVLCEAQLPLGPRPVLAAAKSSKIAIVGQAPGTKVHQSGIPWDDASGRKLRAWMGVEDAVFYDATNIAIVPMGFCYPGKGATGDLPPRKECAPQWHDALFHSMPQIELVLLIGAYAQKYYLKPSKRNLTENVKCFESFGPKYFPLPHPSPRNRHWFQKNPWFEQKVIPSLQYRLQEILGSNSSG